MRQSKMKWIMKLAGVTALLALAGCSSDSYAALPDATPSPPPATRLIGTRWVVDTVYIGQTVTRPPAGASAHLTFDGQGSVNGSVGCNALGGRAAVTDHTIVFSQIITTMMACGGERDRLERAVLAVVESPRVEYVLAGEHLTLTTAGNALRLHKSVS